MDHYYTQLDQFQIKNIDGFENKKTPFGSEFYPLYRHKDSHIKFGIVTNYIDISKLNWNACVKCENSNISLKIYNKCNNKLQQILDKIKQLGNERNPSMIFLEKKVKDNDILSDYGSIIFKINRLSNIINHNAKGYNKREQFDSTTLLKNIIDKKQPNHYNQTVIRNSDKYDVRKEILLHRVLDKKKQIRMAIYPVIFQINRVCYLNYRVKILEAKYPWMTQSDIDDNLKSQEPSICEIYI